MVTGEPVYGGAYAVTVSVPVKGPLGHTDDLQFPTNSVPFGAKATASG